MELDNTTASILDHRNGMRRFIEAFADDYVKAVKDAVANDDDIDLLMEIQELEGVIADMDVEPDEVLAVDADHGGTYFIKVPMWRINLDYSGLSQDEIDSVVEGEMISVWDLVTRLGRVNPGGSEPTVDMSICVLIGAQGHASEPWATEVMMAGNII